MLVSGRAVKNTNVTSRLAGKSEIMTHSTLATGLCIVGAVVVGVSLPLALRRIAPNRTLGFRTPTTLNDERIWYAVNAAFGTVFCFVGAGLIALSVISALSLLSELLLIGLALIWLMIGALAALIRGSAIAARLSSSDDQPIERH